MENKKAQTGGLITGLVFGVASLVIAVIIALVITSTLNGAGLLDDARASIPVTNEQATGGINDTGYTLDGASTANYVPGSFGITSMINGTNGTTISPTTYTVSTTGVVTNVTSGSLNVNITYAYLVKSSSEKATEGISGNFTNGIGNVSGKIPTVLLIAAIVLILGVLAILVGVWQNMRMGGGATL